MGQRGAAILFLLPFISLIGCHAIKTPNGKIPARYLAAAHLVTGVYSGEFANVPTQIQIGLNKRRPVLSVFNSQNNDLVGSNCQSKIGPIQQFWARKNSSGSYDITEAIFGFDPGHCSVQGRTIDLLFGQKLQNMSAKILFYTYGTGPCAQAYMASFAASSISTPSLSSLFPTNFASSINLPPNGPVPPVPDCDPHLKYVYFKGLFRR